MEYGTRFQCQIGRTIVVDPRHLREDHMQSSLKRLGFRKYLTSVYEFQTVFLQKSSMEPSQKTLEQNFMSQHSSVL